MTAPVSIPTLKTDCPDCNGSGEVAAGWTRATWNDPSEPTGLARCSECKGTGKVDAKCDACGKPAHIRLEDDLPYCAGCHARFVEEDRAAGIDPARIIEGALSCR